MNDNTNMKPVNTTDNQVLVIFGANGDLSHRKLLPALYNLFYDNLLPEKFAVIGSGSDPKTEQTFRQEIKEQLTVYAPHTAGNSPEKLTEFLKLLYYKPVNNKVKEDFAGLNAFVQVGIVRAMLFTIFPFPRLCTRSLLRTWLVMA